MTHNSSHLVALTCCATGMTLLCFFPRHALRASKFMRRTFTHYTGTFSEWMQSQHPLRKSTFVNTDPSDLPTAIGSCALIPVKCSKPPLWQQAKTQLIWPTMELCGKAGRGSIQAFLYMGRCLPGLQRSFLNGWRDTNSWGSSIRTPDTEISKSLQKCEKRSLACGASHQPIKRIGSMPESTLTSTRSPATLPTGKEGNHAQ